MSIEAMKLALEAIEDLQGYRPDIDSAIKALSAALSQQPATPEPVAWLYVEDGEVMFGHPNGYRPADARPLVFGDTTPAPNMPATTEPVGFTYKAEIEYADSTGGNGAFWRVPPDLDDEAVPLYTNPAPSVPDDVVRDAERWRALVESGCELVRFRKGSRMLWAVRPCFTSYEYELFATPEQAIDAMLAAKEAK